MYHQPIDYQEQYDQLINLNRQAFDAGRLDLAFHALSTAFCCAREIDSAELMGEVGKIADEQLSWIDRNRSDSMHSSKTSTDRNGGVSVYKLLSKQAARVMQTREMLQTSRRLADRSNSNP